MWFPAKCPLKQQHHSAKKRMFCRNMRISVGKRTFLVDQSRMSISKLSQHTQMCTDPLMRKTQEGCGSLRGENLGAFPKAGPIFQQPLCRKCPNLGRDIISCCRKSVKNFPAASKFAGNVFQQGISDSHGLLDFSELTRKSHPWTNTSVGGNCRRTFRTIGPCEFPQEKVWTNDWSI